MSTFYLLPPRPILAQQCARFLSSIFPGLDLHRAQANELAEMLGDLAGRCANVFVVFREELPEGIGVARALVEEFGAAAGDEVIELASSGVRRWQIQPFAA